MVHRAVAADHLCLAQTGALGHIGQVRPGLAAIDHGQLHPAARGGRGLGQGLVGRLHPLLHLGVAGHQGVELHLQAGIGAQHLAHPGQGGLLQPGGQGPHAPVHREVDLMAQIGQQGGLALGFGRQGSGHGLGRAFHEGRASGFASPRHAVLLAAPGPRRSLAYACVPRLPDALSAGGWLCRARVQTVPWHYRCFFHNGHMNPGSTINATQPS